MALLRIAQRYQATPGLIFLGPHAEMALFHQGHHLNQEERAYLNTLMGLQRRQHSLETFWMELFDDARELARLTAPDRIQFGD